MVLSETELVFDGVGNRGLIVELGRLVPACGVVREEGLDRRIGSVSPQIDVAVDTGTRHDDEVAYGFQLDEHAAHEAVTVALSVTERIQPREVHQSDSGELVLVHITGDGVDGRIKRVVHHGKTAREVVVATCAGSASPVAVGGALVEREVEVHADLEPVLRNALDVGTYGVAVVDVADGVAPLVELRRRDGICGLASATLDGNVVLRLRVVELLEILGPVGVAGITVVGIGLLKVSRRMHAGPGPEIEEFLTRHHVVPHGEVRQGADTVLAAGGDGGLGVVGTGPGGYVNHAVGGT